MLWIYDHKEKRMEECLTEDLPYLRWSRLTQEQFLGGATPSLAWTDRRLLEAYDQLCALFGSTIPVTGGFHRLSSGIHTGQSAHYAGLALDLGSHFPDLEREELRRCAIQYGGFGYVEPPCIAPTWVHVELIPAAPALPDQGYPALGLGDRGVHVLVLEQALCLLGMYRGAITGVYSAATEDGIGRFCRWQAEPVSTRVTGRLWRSIFAVLSRGSHEIELQRNHSSEFTAVGSVFFC